MNQSTYVIKTCCSLQRVDLIIVIRTYIHAVNLHETDANHDLFNKITHQRF